MSIKSEKSNIATTKYSKKVNIRPKYVLHNSIVKLNTDISVFDIISSAYKIIYIDFLFYNSERKASCQV